MKMLMTAMFLLAIAGCGKDSKDDDSRQGGTGAVGEIADISQTGIVTFLNENKYPEWTARQAGPVDSVSAHRNISRTFFNETAATGLAAGEAQLPAGSVVVKEMFAADRTTIVGHAVMAKSKAGSGGETWVFFEGLLPDYANPYYGIGLSTCIGCHSSGKDFVRTSLP